MDDKRMARVRMARVARLWLAAGAGIAAASYAIYVAIIWSRYGHVTRSTHDEVDALLDQFLPACDVAIRHETRVAAPAAVTLAAASEMDIQQSALVRALFKGRMLLLGNHAEDEVERPRTLLAWMKSLGWVVLAKIPGRAVVVGSILRPWEAATTPLVVPPTAFASFHEPGYVKIASTWAAEPLGPNLSRFTIRTRVAATDANARHHFRRYWAVFSPGSLLIRSIALGPVKQAAERQARAAARVAEPRTAPGRMLEVGNRAGRTAQAPREIADDVYWMETGRGITQSNVYFVRSGTAWVLIDTSWPRSAHLIKGAAETLFGVNARPTAILLTHVHPDHAGAALELARAWDVPVYAHPNELRLASGSLETIERYPAGPLDRWFILPLMRAMPRRWVEAMQAQNVALAAVMRAFDASGTVPGLPDWKRVSTPGHSPGHVAFFRESDRVLVAGDAVLTVNLNSLWDFVRNTQRVSGPPYITTWSWPMAKEIVAAIARLDPQTLACGHGIPMTGDTAAQALRAFAARFSSASVSGSAVSDHVSDHVSENA